MKLKQLTPITICKINGSIALMSGVSGLGWIFVSELRKKIAYYTSDAADKAVVEHLNQFVKEFNNNFSEWDKYKKDIAIEILSEKIYKVYPSMSEVAEYNNEMTENICLMALLYNIDNKDLEIFPEPLKDAIKQIIDRFTIKEVVKIIDLDIPEAVFIDSYWLADMTGMKQRDITIEDISEARNSYIIKSKSKHIIITADVTHSFLSKYFMAFNVDNLKTIKDGKLTIKANCDNSKAMLIGSKGRHISWVKIKINDALADLDIKLSHHITHITVE